ncbi:PHP C-terminal domain protein [gamma proteobacterium HTCC5015]|nr:PHP C-terminal domain protein [gamma proteobacterium HTCC5015]
MLDMAAADGIERIVVTPHIHPGTYDNSRDTIASAFAPIADEARARGLSLELSYAAEMHLVPELMQQVEADSVPWLGQLDSQKVLLLEMPHSHIPPGCQQLIRWFCQHDVLPLIAHPERNRELMRHPERIRPLASAGAAFQLTAGSLTGLFGEAAQQCSRKLLNWGIGEVLATDAHSAQRRVPILSRGRDVLADWVGAERAERMTLTWPKAVTDWHFHEH